MLDHTLPYKVSKQNAEMITSAWGWGGGVYLVFHTKQMSNLERRQIPAKSINYDIKLLKVSLYPFQYNIIKSLIIGIRDGEL